MKVTTGVGVGTRPDTVSVIDAAAIASVASSGVKREREGLGVFMGLSLCKVLSELVTALSPPGSASPH